MTCALACAVASAALPAMTTVRSPSPTPKPARAEQLRQAADEADGAGGAERGPVVVVHLVAQPGVADLVQAAELVERHGAAVGHQEPVERHGQAGFAERLHRPRLAEHARAGRNQHVLPAVRVDRVRDQAVHRRGRAAVEAVRQHRVDDGALEHAMQRARRR